MNLTKLFNTNKKNAFGVLLGLGLVVVVVVLVQYNSDKSRVFDGMTDNSVPAMGGAASVTASPLLQSASTLTQDSNLPVPGSSGDQGVTQQAMNLGPGDLLPKDTNSEWASLNPASEESRGMNFLQAPQNIIGINTVGTCLKNGNRQLLRPEPVIPKHEIGPWNQSTNDCDDQFRRPDTW